MAFHLGRIDSADTRRADASGTKQGKKVASAGARRAKAVRLVGLRRGAARTTAATIMGEFCAEGEACGWKDDDGVAVFSSPREVGGEVAHERAAHERDAAVAHRPDRRKNRRRSAALGGYRY